METPGMIVRSRLAKELAARPYFHPTGWSVVAPHTALLPSGKHGQFRAYSRRTDALLGQPLLLKGCERIAEYGGYIRVNGRDGSALFMEVEA